jgi:CheY-like chemotaxis protein
MAKLVVITKGLPASTFELGNHWVTIGRAPTNAFQILEASVSGHHCEVMWRGEELMVRDMRSTNGTFIKGVLASEGVVSAGESFRLGDVEIRFEKIPTKAALPKISIGSLGVAEKNPPPKPATSFLRKDDKRHQVLLVDDSMAFLETLGEMFETLSDKTWEIHRAATADQALAILQQQQIELAVLDINMPMLDGVQLLGVIQRRHPDVKKVVVTAHATDTYRATCLANGAELFLEKPLSPDGFVSIYNLLNDLFVWSQREGFSGTLRQVGLTDVIQIECLRRSSSILEVSSPETRGEIYIEVGTLVHAVAGVLTGEQALYRLLAMSNGQFRVQPFRHPSQRTISGAWEHLLMEAARLSDEKSILPSDDTVMMPRRTAEPPPADNLESGVKDLGDDVVVVSTYDGEWRPVDGAKK